MPGKRQPNLLSELGEGRPGALCRHGKPSSVWVVADPLLVCIVGASFAGMTLEEARQAGLAALEAANAAPAVKHAVSTAPSLGHVVNELFEVRSFDAVSVQAIPHCEA